MWINFTGVSPSPLLHIIITVIKKSTILNYWEHGFKRIWNRTSTLKKPLVKHPKTYWYCWRECRKANLPVEVGLATYRFRIRPILEHCLPVWGGLPKYLREEVEHVQRRSLPIIALPDGYLTTLEKRRDEAAIRYFHIIWKDLNNEHNML